MDKLMVEFATEEECKQRGGHFWNRYDSHGPHDIYGRQSKGFRYALGGEPTEFRKCGLCGKCQRQVPAKWEDHNDTTHQ